MNSATPVGSTKKFIKSCAHAGAGLCQAENDTLETPHVITADFVYLRLRKPDYTESELGEIQRRVKQYVRNGYITYAIFKHEDTPAGALYAERLLAEP